VLSAFALKSEQGFPGPDEPADNGRVYVISGTTLEAKVQTPGPP
jgi:hypothetical protein